MTENDPHRHDGEKPLVWLVDSERAPLANCRQALSPWADVRYFEHGVAAENWSDPPDIVFFSAEIGGGAGGDEFLALLARAENIPLVAVARLRSLAQAVGFFRAGAADYLSLPLDADDARERAFAALDRAESLAMQGVVVQLEPVDQDPGEITLSLLPSESLPPSEIRDAPTQEDILAQLDAEKLDADDSANADARDRNDDEPVAVDGLPIPTLWEELPCGLMVFDSSENLVFANMLALELFGAPSLAQLEDGLENNRARFAAYADNQKPLPDNQWPHLVAARTRTARSATVSIEKPDKRRAWLRVDCLPHLHDGAISRLLVTVVNLTGVLPPLAPRREGARPADEAPPAKPAAKPAKRQKSKKRGKK